MNLQRKLTLVVATGAIALGAGHLVQKNVAERKVETAETRRPDVATSSIVTVAAGAADTAAPVIAPSPVNLDGEKFAAVDPVINASTENLTVLEKPDFANIPAVQPAPEDEPATVLAVASPEADQVPPTVALPEMPVAEACPIKIELIPQPGAMVGISVLAPCHVDERAVLRHAGLAVTGKTSSAGSLFAIIPAMTALADIEVAFGSGDKNSQSIAVPDFNGIHRFAVQWQDHDMFQLHAFENGASYNQAGHYSAANTKASDTGASLTVLGDSSTSLPLLAEVFTFSANAPTEVVVEAAVTEETCGREIFAETVEAKEGSVEIGDIVLAMPDCSSSGDILVLKNLAGQTKVAAAN